MTLYEVLSLMWYAMLFGSLTGFIYGAWLLWMKY